MRIFYDILVIVFLFDNKNKCTIVKIFKVKLIKQWTKLKSKNIIIGKI